MPKIFDDTTIIEKIQIRLPDVLLSILDDYKRDKGYSNRSELIRDIVRQHLKNEGWLK